MKQETVDTFWARIYVAGDVGVIESSCRKFCMKGLCVTVKPTKFIYTGGMEDGAEVGLVNYPRFPSTPDEIQQNAVGLAWQIILDGCQLTALVVTPTKTTWISRKDDYEGKQEK